MQSQTVGFNRAEVSWSYDLMEVAKKSLLNFAEKSFLIKRKKKNLKMKFIQMSSKRGKVGEKSRTANNKLLSMKDIKQICKKEMFKKT